MINKSQKILKLIIAGLILIIPIGIAIYTTASPDEPAFGCHLAGDYTITANITEYIGEPSVNFSVEVTGTGTGLVIDVYEETTYGPAFDNDLFTVSPGKIIADGDPADLDGNGDAIRVILTFTPPSEDGSYTLRILSRGALAGGPTVLAEFDIEVTIGAPIPPSLLEMIFDHYGLYLGVSILSLALLGTVAFHINQRNENESKIPGIILAASFALSTINLVLVLNDTMDYVFNLMDLTNIDILIQIIVGSIGYVAGIIVVFGIFTNIPMEKLKGTVNIMLVTIIFNFFYGTFTLTPPGG
jgi:hypothetical protein